MTRQAGLALLTLAALAVAAPPAGAAFGFHRHHDDAAAPTAGLVTISGNAFHPGPLTVLVGDRVTWRNDDFVDHAVASDDAGAFDSPRLASGDAYGHTFAAAGRFAYVCAIHPFMHGEVDAAPLVLDAPPAPVLLGATATLRGRAQAGVAQVAVAREGASGPPALASVAADGTFAARVRVDVAGRWRATAGALASPSVDVPVTTDQRVLLRAHGDGGVQVSTRPPRPGARLVLERYVRERFAWLAVARLRLDAHGRATAQLGRAARGRVQAVLPAAGGLPRSAARIRLR
jgi:plastocyanin